jgi:LuxR family maltose regulon positive regulatory protein
VLALLATGATTAGIAAALGISVTTVKTHLASVYRKLPAGGRREAIAAARTLGLL